MTRNAQTVIAGNDYLKSWAEPVNPKTIVIPTCIELTDYPLLGPNSVTSAPSEPVIGWIGTRVNLMYLKTLQGAPGANRADDAAERAATAEGGL